MKEIDTGSWGEFRVMDLFDRIERGRVGNVGILPGGDVPYISAGTANNGHARSVAPASELVSEGNCVALICDGSVGYNLYQPARFAGSVNLQLGYHSLLNQWNGMFLVACLDKSIERYGYSYAHKRNSEALMVETVFLPVTPAGDPDWDYMEQTMRDIMAEREAALDSLQALAGA